MQFLASNVCTCDWKAVWGPRKKDILDILDKEIDKLPKQRTQLYDVYQEAVLDYLEANNGVAESVPMREWIKVQLEGEGFSCTNKELFAAQNKLCDMKIIKRYTKNNVWYYEKI